MNRRKGVTLITLTGQSQKNSFECLTDPVSLINSVHGGALVGEPLDMDQALRTIDLSRSLCVDLKAPISEAHLSSDGLELTIDPYKLTVCDKSALTFHALMLLCNDTEQSQEIEEEISIPALSDKALKFRDLDIKVTIHFIL